MLKRTLILSSPHLKGRDVRDVQYLLSHNRFGDFHPGKRDSDYGDETAHAAKRAKYQLGYPKAKVNGRFGPKLYAFLHGDKRLTSAMRLRRKARLKKLAKVNTVKAKALQWALTEARKHVTESPPGSNDNPYGRWFGFNRVPWCAEFVSNALARGGDRHGIKTALAFQFEYWARAHQHGLSITSNPEPGDIVVYHHNQGHVGIFYRWVSRRSGRFQAAEGNTSKGGSQDNGGAVLVQDRDTDWVRTVFVRVGE